MEQVPRRKPVPSRSSSTTPSEALLMAKPESATTAQKGNSPGFGNLERSQSHQEGDASTSSTYDLRGRRHQYDDDAEVKVATDTRRHQAVAIMADVAVVISPALILGFVISVWRLDDTEYVNSSLDPWHNAITVLATAFPILFASIVGRLMAAAARWRLERGAELGLLETLMGSRTVGSTIITVAQLRLFIVAALRLLGLWAVSPLGAQAFLRVLSVEARTESEEAAVAYYDTRASARINWRFFDQDSFHSHRSLMSTIFRTLIIGPKTSKADYTDLWGNIKIPFLQRDDERVGDDEWDPILREGAPGTSGIPYSSLLGVPFSLPPTASFAAGNISFVLESTYVDLRCDRLRTSAGIDVLDQHLESFLEPEWRIGQMTNGTWWVPCLPVNGSGIFMPRCKGATALWAIALDRFVDTILWTRGHERHDFTPALFADQDGIEAGRTRLLFVSRHMSLEQGRYTQQSTTSECDVTQKYVESRVNCTRLEGSDAAGAAGSPGCRVVAQRPRTRKHPSEHISFLSFTEVFAEVAKLMPSTGMLDRTPFLDIPVGYLADPSRLIQPEEGASMANVTALEFSRRLAQLVNTFIGTTQLVANATLGSMPAEPWEPETLVTTTETRRFVEHVRVSRLWIISCVAASLILLVCGALSVVLRNLANSPEVLGYVSSSIRESRFVAIPEETRHLDGLDLTKAIHEERVIWGPVQGAWDGEQEHLLGIVREEDVKKRYRDGQV